MVRKGWKGEKHRHSMAAKGIISNANNNSAIKNSMNNIFKRIDWLEPYLEMSVYEEMNYQYNYAVSEMKYSSNQFKYLNDFEFMKWEIMNKFIDDNGDDLLNYVPHEFEYKPDVNEYIGKNNWVYTYFAENPVFINKMKEIYDEHLKQLYYKSLPEYHSEVVIK